MNSIEKDNVIMIRKASGDVEPFNPEKLARSLRSAGAGEDLAERILADISAWITSGISTRKIYKRAMSMLGRQQKAAGTRYRIKDALMELGNSGYPFEHFTGELFKMRGYEISVGTIVEGAAGITHEMDVIATGMGRQILVECKYSQKQNTRIGVQVPLYVHSRIEDIIARRSGEKAYTGLRFSGGLVTNTRFSRDSIIYAEHYGLELLSWDYPRGEALKDMVQRYRLYPVTILKTLDADQKEKLIREGIVTCILLAENKAALKPLGPGNQKLIALENELNTVLQDA